MSQKATKKQRRPNGVLWGHGKRMSITARPSPVMELFSSPGPLKAFCIQGSKIEVSGANVQFVFCERFEGTHDHRPVILLPFLPVK